MSTNMIATPGRSLNNILPRVFFAASLSFAIFSLCKGWHGAIIDLHSFRQTQTAITVTSMLNGGPWLAYETPVFGPPWSVPLEFPLYQWLVALMAKTGLLPVEQSGRLISILMFLSTIYPLYRIFKALKLKSGQIFLVLTLYCLSPQYLFWSRTFMIESTALALSLYYLMFIFTLYGPRESERKSRWPLLIGIAVIGMLAATVKITTFMAFFAAGMAFFSWQWLTRKEEIIQQQGRISRLDIKFIIFSAVIPVTALFLWTFYCDSLKDLNPIARNLLTSTALQKWNFGTIQQKLSPQTWEWVVKTILPNLIGNSWLLVIALFAGFFCHRKWLITAAALFALFLLPLAVFTNLHYRHNYYAYANGVFLIAAIGLICSDLWISSNHFKRVLGASLFCAVITFSSYHYLDFYFPRQGMAGDYSYLKNDMDRNISGDDDIIIVYGAGWSPEIPYYLGRKAVMMIDFETQTFREIIKNLEPYRVGALLFYGKAGHDEVLKRVALSAYGIQSTHMKNYGQIVAYFNRQ